MKEPDFSGWATKALLRCSDGRTIMPDAFKHQDELTVPLVYMHGHTNIENVLGHAVLKNRDEGVWVDAYFNDSDPAKHAAKAVAHGDITQLSIWANGLVEKAKNVVHGVIREVSLVLSERTLAH
jgi:phage head maturation protease